ncbi:MAG TPA: EpsI family protein [Vicinamibacterales bacterium]|nr:EpsI family protein [Vicinamibacterales bacterium]
MVRRALVVAVLILAGRFAIDRIETAEARVARVPLASVPDAVGEWRGRDLPRLDPEVARVLGADEYLHRRYVGADGVPVDLFVGYYRSQREGDAIHSPRNCLPGAGWRPVEAGTSVVPLGGRAARVNRYIVERGGERQLVLYWYQGRGRIVASEYANKALLVVDSLRRRRSDGALVRVMSPAQPGAAKAMDRAMRFVSAIYPRLAEAVP